MSHFVVVFWWYTCFNWVCKTIWPSECRIWSPVRGSHWFEWIKPGWSTGIGSVCQLSVCMLKSCIHASKLQDLSYFNQQNKCMIYHPPLSLAQQLLWMSEVYCLVRIVQIFCCSRAQGKPSIWVLLSRTFWDCVRQHCERIEALSFICERWASNEAPRLQSNRQSSVSFSWTGKAAWDFHSQKTFVSPGLDQYLVSPTCWLGRWHAEEYGTPSKVANSPLQEIQPTNNSEQKSTSNCLPMLVLL